MAHRAPNPSIDARSGGRIPACSAAQPRAWLRSGEGGIRTHVGGMNPPNRLAGGCLQPLGHLSRRALAPRSILGRGSRLLRLASAIEPPLADSSNAAEDGPKIVTHSTFAVLVLPKSSRLITQSSLFLQAPCAMLAPLDGGGTVSSGRFALPLRVAVAQCCVRLYGTPPGIKEGDAAA